MPGSRRPPLDSRIRIVTPENIAFEYRLAGPFWRLPAYLVDLLIRAALLWGSSLIGLTILGLTFGTGPGWMFFFVAWFILEWFYGGLFETYCNGQTPGKRLFRIRVMSVDGQPIDALQAVLRNLLRTVDGLPCLFGDAMLMPTFLVGLVTIASTRRYQRLGDLACGTIVVIDEPERLRGVARVDEPQVEAALAAIPPDFVASRELTRVLAMYLDRRQYFSAARRAEIARHVGEPLAARFQLPPGIDHDALLCAVYQRVFVSDHSPDGSHHHHPKLPRDKNLSRPERGTVLDPPDAKPERIPG